MLMGSINSLNRSLTNRGDDLRKCDNKLVSGPFIIVENTALYLMMTGYTYISIQYWLSFQLTYYSSAQFTYVKKTAKIVQSAIRANSHDATSCAYAPDIV